jgi:hypothetical protein
MAPRVLCCLVPPTQTHTHLGRSYLLSPRSRRSPCGGCVRQTKERSGAISIVLQRQVPAEGEPEGQVLMHQLRITAYGPDEIQRAKMMLGMHLKNQVGGPVGCCEGVRCLVEGGAGGSCGRWTCASCVHVYMSVCLRGFSAHEGGVFRC